MPLQPTLARKSLKVNGQTELLTLQAFHQSLQPEQGAAS
jgi:hypothetical protein